MSAGARTLDTARGAAIAVVGVSASADGLKAFERLREVMSPQMGMTFVMLPHLDLSDHNLAAEALARHASIAVCEMLEGGAVTVLRAKIRSACGRALRDRVEVTVGDVQIGGQDGLVPVQVQVELLQQPAAAQPLLLATFSACAPSAQGDAGVTRREQTASGLSLRQPQRSDVEAPIEEGRADQVPSETAGCHATHEEHGSLDEGASAISYRLEAKVEELERRIIEVTTAEQERIGREIHDGIGQQLTAVSMLAAGLERRLTGAGRPEEAKMLRDLVGLLQDSLAQTRALARGLSPVKIAPEGLIDALSELAEDVQVASGVSCRLEAAASVQITDEILATHLYRIVQEAVHNALRHGHPENIEIRLHNNGAHALVLSVHDDGSGIQRVEKEQGGLGLHIMRYRAGILGAQLSIEGADGAGTLVRCVVPASH